MTLSMWYPCEIVLSPALRVARASSVGRILPATRVAFNSPRFNSIHQFLGARPISSPMLLGLDFGPGVLLT
jgi:hypothetical protein